jgi:hypothetical protein
MYDQTRLIASDSVAAAIAKLQLPSTLAALLGDSRQKDMVMGRPWYCTHVKEK